VRFPIEVIGFEDQHLSVEVEGVLSNPHLLVNGQHAPGDKGGPYLLRREKGGEEVEVQAEFKSLNWLDPLPRLVIGDEVVPYAPAIHWAWWVLAATPVLLVFFLDRGIVPFLWGGAVALLNGRLLRTESPFPARIGFVLLSTLVGFTIHYLTLYYLDGR
jgi:hypothetical protein